jgi:GYF domain 2
MAEWFYTREGQQNGPIGFKELVELSNSGRLNAVSDLVWNASMTHWTPAGQVPGLFSAPFSAATVVMNTANPYAAPESSLHVSATSAEIALTEIQPGSEQIDPMACFNRGLDITKRQFLNIFVIGIVYFAILIGMSFVGSGVEMLAAFAGGAASSSGGETASDAGSIIVVVVTIISRIVQQIVTIYLQLGLARVGLNIVSGKEASIGMLFGEGSKLLRAIGASIIFGFAVVIGLLLLIVPGIYIALRYGQFINAIVDRDLGVFDAFAYSDSITTNNLMNLFLVGLISFLAIIVGMIPCGLGLIFLGPVVWMTGIVAYRWLQYGDRAAKDHPGTETPMLTAI